MLWRQSAAVTLALCLTLGLGALAADEFTSAPGTSGSSPFVWQPLPLRATFRPLNRRPPTLTISERSVSSEPPNDNSFATSARDFLGSSFFQPLVDSSEPSSITSRPTAPTTTTTTTTTTATSTTTTTTTTTPRPRPLVTDEDDELPTRQPMMRFRPTRAPSDDEDAFSPASSPFPATEGASGATSNSPTGNWTTLAGASRMSRECFECICEASTNCNPQSRCQTSDVRHTRCGLFLISYDQWLAAGLSRELVTREALARDAAADERAFYECVTERACAERLLAIYLARHQKDCDRDGRVDCYDLAAVHHSGLEQCASEALLDSQYWSDFNACLGFGR